MPTTFVTGQQLTGPALTAALAQATADAASYFLPRGEMVPALHHTKLAASSTPEVWFVGDSTMTLASANPVSFLYTTHWKIRSMLQAAYPSKTFTFRDLAVGGAGIGQIGGQITAGLGISTTPTQIYIGTGVNDGPSFSDATLVAVLTQIAGISTKPDTFFVTPRRTSQFNAYNSGNPNWQPSMDWIGSYIRTTARTGVNAAFGISSPASFCAIDVGRAYTAGNRGLDYDQQSLVEVIAPNAPIAATFTSGVYYAPACDGDFDITLTFPSSSVLSSEIKIGLDPLSVCYIDLAYSGGTLFGQYNTGNSGHISLSGSTSAALTGPAVLRVIARRGYIACYWNGALIMQGLVPRFYGGLTAPKVTFVTPPGGLSMSVTSYFAGVAKQTASVITDALYYKDSTGQDGNNINHPSSNGFVSIDEPYLDSLRWV